MIHPITKKIFVLGRADGVLNPGGVRFGLAEIYNVVKAFSPDHVADSLGAGQRRPQDSDESVLLFLEMKKVVPFTQSLVQDVKTLIKKELSARHVPRYVFETPDIPVCAASKHDKYLP
jgi:acetoacetyl-CoA synthetase